jgi:hypothetical protein
MSERIPANQRKKWAGLSFCIQQGKNGDANMARNLLGAFAGAAKSHLKTGRPIPAPLLDYVVDCLTRISRGEAADVALNLRLKRGKPQPPELQQILRDAILADELDAQRAQGLSHEEAVGRMESAKLGHSRTIERAVARHRKRKTLPGYRI